MYLENALVSLLCDFVFTVLINPHSYGEGDALSLNYTFQTTSKYTSCELETRAMCYLVETPLVKILNLITK